MDKAIEFYNAHFNLAQQGIAINWEQVARQMYVIMLGEKQLKEAQEVGNV